MRTRITRSVEQNAPFYTQGQLLGHGHCLPPPFLGISPLFYKAKREHRGRIREFRRREKADVCVGGVASAEGRDLSGRDGGPRAAPVLSPPGRPPRTVPTQRGGGERARAGTSTHCPPCHVLLGHPLSLSVHAFGIKPRSIFLSFIFFSLKNNGC